MPCEQIPATVKSPSTPEPTPTLADWCLDAAQLLHIAHRTGERWWSDCALNMFRQAPEVLAEELAS